MRFAVIFPVTASMLPNTFTLSPTLNSTPSGTRLADDMSTIKEMPHIFTVNKVMVTGGGGGNGIVLEAVLVELSVLVPFAGGGGGGVDDARASAVTSARIIFALPFGPTTNICGRSFASSMLGKSNASISSSSIFTTPSPFPFSLPLPLPLSSRANASRATTPANANIRTTIASFLCKDTDIIYVVIYPIDLLIM